MSRRFPERVKWALGVLRDNGYKGKVERGPDGRVKTVTWSVPEEEKKDDE